MKKLYKIIMTHYAPKDSSSAIREYVIASDDREVFEYLANGYADWKSIIDCYEDYDYETVEDATYEYEEIYNNRGDDREVYDLYYGATQYCWKEVELNKESDTENMFKLMIANNLAVEI